jgi:hypothetical protein
MELSDAVLEEVYLKNADKVFAQSKGSLKCRNFIAI